MCYALCDMFSTSHDILLLTIAACVAAFTIFLCWGMFYLIAMISNTYKIIKDARRMVDKVEGILDAIKEKINSSASYLFLIGEGLKKVLEMSKEWRHRKDKDDEDEDCDCDCDHDHDCDCQKNESSEKKKARKAKVETE